MKYMGIYIYGQTSIGYHWKTDVGFQGASDKYIYGYKDRQVWNKYVKLYIGNQAATLE
jgi:hypothetical protein